MPKKPDLSKAHGTCASCKHYLAERWECHRYPPQLVVGRDEDDNDSALALWPQTEAQEWCGEFSPVN